MRRFGIYAVIAVMVLGSVTASAAFGKGGLLGERRDMKLKAEARDVAPFALPNAPPGEFWFEEPRDIVRVVVEFKGAPPADIGLSYLRKTWPETRIEERAKESLPFGFGWTHQDDWFNAEWQRAAVKVARAGRHKLQVEFPALTSEIPTVKDYDVTFRRTLAVRVEAPDPAAIASVAIFTASAPSRTALKVTLDAGRETPGAKIGLSGYNASIEGVHAVSGTTAADSEVGLGAERPRSFTVDVGHMNPAHAYSGDDGLVTFALSSDTFTVSLTSLREQGAIWFEELGVFVASADDPTTFDAYRAANADNKTLSQRVLEQPEQSLAGAFYGQPRPHVSSYNLGCIHARQRFWVESNGDLVLFKRNVTWVPGKDSERFKCKGHSRFFFGLEKWPILARFPDPAPALVYNIHGRREGLVVEQKSLCVPLLGPLNTVALAGGTQLSGDDPMACLVRFRFRNEGDRPVRAELPIRYSQESDRAGNGVPKSPLDKLTLSGNKVWSDFEGTSIVRWAMQTAMRARETSDGVVVAQSLNPGQSCDIVLKIPYIALDTARELALLDGLDFDQCLRDVTAYWQEAGRSGAQLRTPEPQLAELYKSHLAHVQISDFAMPAERGVPLRRTPGSPGDPDLVNTSVGTSTYGNFSNESCMIVHELDQRGLGDEARKRLAVWLKYQGTVPQPGNFTDFNGMFYGAGGFECGSYNQHHGWVLWCAAEHYLLTHDEEWFRNVADKLIAGADWVFRQRRNTMTPLPHSRGWEYGFLPAGSLEDVTDFYYWLSTNSLTWRGVEWTARALEAAGHAEAARVRKEADAYKQDLVRGFDTMRQHAPLVRLRDGRWVPDYPSRLYRRGREVGWIRETLEGSVYLLISGLYDAKGPQAGWILDDYQDNRYPSPPYGYSIPDFDRNWFARAGLSMQPNLLAGLMPYLDRDEPELYIWMFYNCWCACYREEINGMVEHPAPVLGESNTAVFKTSDEANAVSWLRCMFVYPSGDELHLGRAIPRAWFGQPEPFEARDVVTPFGKVGIRYEPSLEGNVVKATASLDLVRDPGKTLVRFRLPKDHKIGSVSVNGSPWTKINLDSGDVDISGLKGEVAIEVAY